MDDPVVAEKLDKSPENSENSETLPENLPENPPAKKKNGRPPGSKDKTKRTKKITIIEEPLVPLAAPSSSSSAPKAKAEPKAKPAKVQINPEPVIQYVDRFIEHSPRTLMDIYTNHAMNMPKAKRDARKEHFSNMITNRLQQLP